MLEDQKELLDKLYRGEITRTNDKNYIEWYKKKFKRECLAKVFKTKIILSIQSKILECMKYEMMREHRDGRIQLQIFSAPQIYSNLFLITLFTVYLLLPFQSKRGAMTRFLVRR